MSSPIITPTNYDIGPAILTLNGNDVGGVIDKVTISIKYHKAPLKADQLGDTIIDQAISGMDVTIATSLIETRDKSKVQAVFPNMDLGGTLPHNFLNFNNKVAVRDLPQAVPLLIHPIVESDSSLDFDWYFWKVLATDESSLVIGPTEQYKFKVTWRVFPDVSVTPIRFMRYGDHTL